MRYLLTSVKSRYNYFDEHWHPLGWRLQWICFFVVIGNGPKSHLWVLNLVYNFNWKNITIRFFGNHQWDSYMVRGMHWIATNTLNLCCKKFSTGILSWWHLVRDFFYFVLCSPVTSCGDPPLSVRINIWWECWVFLDPTTRLECTRVKCRKPVELTRQMIHLRQHQTIMVTLFCVGFV